MKNRYTQGFTLIELLVVITIIGILSAIVMTSLTVSRGKGTNANVQTSFAQIRSQANLYVNDFGNYGTVAVSNTCTVAMATANTVFANAAMVKVITALQNNTNSTANCGNTIGVGPTWAVTMRLPQAIGSNQYICTDANSALKYYVANPGTVTVCP